MRAVRLLAAGEAIQLGAHFGFEAENLLGVCDALGGSDLPRCCATTWPHAASRADIRLAFFAAMSNLRRGWPSQPAWRCR
jgi:hypothetical protein